MATQDKNADPLHGGAAIQSLRRSKGLSQQDLAARVGLSRSRIQQFESGHAIPVGALRRIAKALKVDPLDLAGKDHETPEIQKEAADEARDVASKLASLAARNPKLARELYDLGRNYIDASSERLFPLGQFLFEQVQSIFSGLSSRSVTIPHPSPIHMWTDFLESELLTQQDIIEAVTVGDVRTWWQSPDGEAYNELNLSLAASGVAIERVFVVASVAELLSLRTPLLRQLERGIVCYLISFDAGREIPGFLLIATRRERSQAWSRYENSASAYMNPKLTDDHLIPRRLAALHTLDDNTPATTSFSDDVEQCRAAHLMFEATKNKAYRIRKEDIENLGAVAAALGLPDTQTGEPPILLWTTVMKESDAARHCFIKSFEYLRGPHFDEHVAAIKRGVSYNWLLYESRPSSRGEAGFINVQGKVVDKVRRYGERLRNAGISDGDFERQITVRVLPRMAVEGVVTWDDVLPLRVIFFGTEFCLMTPEWSSKSYDTKLGAMALARHGFNDLHRTFVTLYEACPTYGEYLKGRSPDKFDSLTIHKLRTLYGQFVTSIKDHVGRLTMGIS